MVSCKAVRVILCTLVTLMVASFFFASAVLISRTNSLVAKGDGQYAAQKSPAAWNKLDAVPYRLVIRYSDGEAHQKLREAVALLEDGEDDMAAFLLTEVVRSDDKQLASLALTIQGVIHALQDMEDPELLKEAIDLFQKAIGPGMNPENEDAKYDLELFLTLLILQGQGEGPADGSWPVKIPGTEPGESGSGSGY